MPPRHISKTLICALAIVVVGTITIAAQNAPENSSSVTQDDPRPFAAGVLKTIKPEIDHRDLHTMPMILPGVTAKDYDLSEYPKKDTLRGQTRSIILFKDVWQLEISFLPLRQLDVDVPTVSGITRRNAWYFVYRVRNVGKSISHKKVTDPKYGYIEHELQVDADLTDSASLPDRFFPQVILKGYVEDPRTRLDDVPKYKEVQYMDTILPTVVDQIQQEEDPNRELLDSVEISRRKLEIEKSENDGGVWGVAVFVDVDPRIDYVSLQIKGLSNAYRIKKTGEKPELVHKTLQLNFWRPGDDRDEADDIVDYGIPLVDDPVEQITIARRYKLPGPLLRVYDYTPDRDRYVMVGEADAEVEMQDFDSKALPKLNAGELTDPLRLAISNAGYDVGDAPAIETRAQSQVWRLKGKNAEGEERILEVRFEPQYWEKSGRGIRFIRSLDHMWIYR